MKKVIGGFLIGISFLISCNSTERKSEAKLAVADPKSESLEIEPVHKVDSSLNSRAARLAGKILVSQDSTSIELVKKLNSNWDLAVKQKFVPITDWHQKENIGSYYSKSFGVFYPFSGPDFPFVHTFYPDAEIYILVGLEEVGNRNSNMISSEPDYNEFIANASNYFYFSNRLGFFRTEDMQEQFKEKGVIDILGFYLNKFDCNLISMNLMKWENELGAPRELERNEKADVCRIEFLNKNNTYSELYFFQFDLSNSGIQKNGNLLKWVKEKMEGKDMVSLSKAASYLMHSNNFSSISNFILENSKLQIQDDSGLDFRVIQNANKNYKLYGNYTKTISLFEKRFIPELKEKYEGSDVKPLPFRLGYSSAHGETNLQLIY
jgi:hypothetical protein